MDGITLQALWLRLEARPGYTLGTTARARQFVWQCVQAMDQVHCYLLAEPRNELVLHDRYQHMDGDLGIVIEPENLPEDIYPYSLVEEGEVRGSAASFHSRKPVDKVREPV